MIDTPRITDYSIPELSEQLSVLGEPKFRVPQIIRWMYKKRVRSFTDMVNIPLKTRKLLSENFSLDIPKQKAISNSQNGDAVKFGFSVTGTELLCETVLLYDKKRRTLCISSQLGCGLNCSFCATAKMGFIRNLKLSEILGQLLHANQYLHDKNDKEITHIVFMGMGEALSNFDTFKKAVDIITAKEAFNLSAKRITVSTAGVVPSIERLSKEKIGVNLAISLNAFDDSMRDQIMPINKKYPIAQLLAAAAHFVKETGNQLTFEYVVIHGKNDTPTAINKLSKLLHGIPCKVNCIPLNKTSRSMVDSTTVNHAKALAESLYARGITATVRKSRGQDIDGACGQLNTK